MLSPRLTVSCVLLVAMGLANVQAISDEGKAKILAAVLPHVAECSQEFGISLEQMKADREAGNLDPCVVNCLLKKIKVIDDNGALDAQKAQELTQLYLGNEKEGKTVEEIINTCSSVKPDGAGDGCEYAKALYECALPFKSRLFP